MSRSQVEIAIGNLQFARTYTNSLLEGLSEDDWFGMPQEGVTHIAWQVGHLAMAEYALTMMRLRGKEPADAELISNDFFRSFKKGSQPTARREDYPSVDEIRQTFTNIHQQALRELTQYNDKELDVKLPEPHAVFDTKMGSLFFCSAHEMLHAGQIGLLRRLLGHASLR